MANFRPIQTVFKGYKFRSRTEARWAVFFETMELRWFYEREGFELEAEEEKKVFYLPDFWLPELDCFVEIKGEHPKSDEEIKARLLAEASGKRVFIFFGGIYLPNELAEKCIESAFCYGPGGQFSRSNWFAKCPKCGLLDIVQYGKNVLLGCNHRLGGRLQSHDHKTILLACTKARQERFTT